MKSWVHAVAVRSEASYRGILQTFACTSGDGRTQVVDSAQIWNGTGCAASNAGKNKVESSTPKTRMLILPSRLFTQSRYNPPAIQWISGGEQSLHRSYHKTRFAGFPCESLTDTSMARRLSAQKRSLA